MIGLKKKLQELKKNKGLEEKDLIKIHDYFMVEYGWIPLEEFKNLPIPTLFNLLSCINERKEREQQKVRR